MSANILMKNLSNPKHSLKVTLAVILTVVFSGIMVLGQSFTPAKLATINSDAFSDPKSGVSRLIGAYTKVDLQMKDKRDELIRINAEIEGLIKELNDTKVIADQKTLQAKSEKVEQLKVDLKRKSEDAQALYERRIKEVTEPIYSELMIALEVYSKKRGIDCVLDTKVSPGIFVFNSAMDITAAFIAEFNAKPINP